MQCHVISVIDRGVFIWDPLATLGQAHRVNTGNKVTVSDKLWGRMPHTFSLQLWREPSPLCANPPSDQEINTPLRIYCHLGSPIPQPLFFFSSFFSHNCSSYKKLHTSFNKNYSIFTAIITN